MQMKISICAYIVYSLTDMCVYVIYYICKIAFTWPRTFKNEFPCLFQIHTCQCWIGIGISIWDLQNCYLLKIAILQSIEDSNFETLVSAEDSNFATLLSPVDSNFATLYWR